MLRNILATQTSFAIKYLKLSARISEFYKTKDNRIGISRRISFESHTPKTVKWLALKELLDIIKPLDGTFGFWRYNIFTETFQKYGHKYLFDPELEYVRKIIKALSTRTFFGKIIRELFTLKNCHLLFDLKKDLRDFKNLGSISKKLFPIMTKIVGTDILIRTLMKIISKNS